VLFYLSNDATLGTQIADAGAIAPLVAMLIGGAVDSTRYAAGTLTNLSNAYYELNFQIADAGALPPLVALLSADDPTSKANAAGLMLNFSTNDALARLLPGSGALPPLVVMLADDETTYRETAVGTLYHLSGNATMRQPLAEAGAIAPLVAMLATDDLQCRQHAIGTLLRLLCTAALRLQVADTGAIAPIVRMLADDDAICRTRAVTVLTLLVDGDGLACRIADAGAIVPLVSMLAGGDTKCKKYAAATMSALAAHAGLQLQIAGAGAIAPLVEMLAVDDVPTKNDVLAGLMNLANHTELNHRIVDAGALPAMVALLADVEVEIKGRAAGVLGNLAMDKALTTRIADAGAIAPLVAMLIGGGSVDSTRYAAGVFINLSNGGELKPQIADAGALPPLVALLSADDPGTKVSALGVMFNFSLDHTVMHRLVESGALPLLVAMLADDETANRESAVGTLYHLSGNATMRQPLAEAGAIAPLVAMLADTGEEHKHVKCQQFSAGTLRNLSLRSRSDSLSSAHFVIGGCVPVLVHRLDSDDFDIRSRCSSTLNNLGLTQFEHLPLGTIQLLRRIESTPQAAIAQDHVVRVALRHADMDSALVLCSQASDLAPAAAAAATICIGMLMSIDKTTTRADAPTPSQLTHSLFRSKLQPVLACALCNGNPGMNNTGNDRTSLRMQAAKAIEHVLTIAAPRSSVELTDPVTGWEDLTSMLEGGAYALADLKFEVEGAEISAHRVMLHVRSEYFKRMFEARVSEQHSNKLEIKECRLPVFRIVHRFLYGGLVAQLLSQDIAQEVLMAADRFQLPLLKGVVEAFLSRQLDASNALSMRALAKMANAVALEQVCTIFALRNLSKVVKAHEQDSQAERADADAGGAGAGGADAMDVDVDEPTMSGLGNEVECEVVAAAFFDTLQALV
jgi:hypothetical protein